MIFATVRELKAAYNNQHYPKQLQEHYRVYYFFDSEDFLLYIGKSKCAVDRAIQHIVPGHGWGGNQIFDIVLQEMLPLSLEWKVALYTVDDCMNYLKQIGYEMKHLVNYADEIADWAEREMIRWGKPYYNVIHNNRPGERPKKPDWLNKYIRRGIKARTPPEDVYGMTDGLEMFGGAVVVD